MIINYYFLYNFCFADIKFTSLNFLFKITQIRIKHYEKITS